MGKGARIIQAIRIFFVIGACKKTVKKKVLYIFILFFEKKRFLLGDHVPREWVGWPGRKH